MGVAIHGQGTPPTEPSPPKWVFLSAPFQPAASLPQRACPLAPPTSRRLVQAGVMDALRSAGRAILRSPSIGRNSQRLPRHHKLPENWTDTKETLLEGVVFQLKYLGMTLVEKPKGEDMAAAAIRRIIVMARSSAKKLQKVIVTVTPGGLSLQDGETSQLIDNVSIYRISYCTTDKVQDKVFAYVAQNQASESLECHAFLCPKKKLAQAVTLTVAQAFKVALDLWESAHEGKEQPSPCRMSEAASLGETPGAQAGGANGSFCPSVSSHTRDGRLLQMDSQEEEEEEEDDLIALDEAFTRLAEPWAPVTLGQSRYPVGQKVPAQSGPQWNLLELDPVAVTVVLYPIGCLLPVIGCVSAQRLVGSCDPT
ncbi:low density lipoprotein receptor adapter protein 1-like isoform X2 [Xenopus tropicalis]|uniref:Low density lipoprotein receptor adapter protein 1-like n=1 Tax=Xenopus tropicalis TaxID=8364 RepID=A0A803JB06_XENTR|nr:low density lipoprotein receptor adapter protein 1-like isoform X2 [Xenopus tropicalis]